MVCSFCHEAVCESQPGISARALATVTAILTASRRGVLVALFFSDVPIAQKKEREEKVQYPHPTIVVAIDLEQQQPARGENGEADCEDEHRRR